MKRCGSWWGESHRYQKRPRRTQGATGAEGMPEELGTQGRGRVPRG